LDPSAATVSRTLPAELSQGFLISGVVNVSVSPEGEIPVAAVVLPPHPGPEKANRVRRLGQRKRKIVKSSLNRFEIVLKYFLAFMKFQ